MTTASPVKYDPNAVAELRALLAAQESAKMVAADELRVKIADADKVLQALRAELAELVPPSNINPKRPRTSNPSAANDAENPHRAAFLAYLSSGPKTTKELKAVIGDSLGSVTDYHMVRLVQAGIVRKVQHGVYELAPIAPAAEQTPSA